MKKILIVDDDMFVRLMLKKKLEDQGYDVIVAENGYEGINLASAELPDLVIMDVRMPQMNGLEATKNLRQDPNTKDISIFISTAEEKIKSEFSAATGRAVQGFIEKPYKADQFIDKVNNFFGKNK